METLRVGDTRLEVAWYGRGDAGAPTIVLLHEGLGCVAMWRDLPAEVAEATGCRVLAYSRAGYGGSDPVPLPRPLTDMEDEATEALPRLLGAVGVDDVILLGHSDGASIAIVFAASAPKARVRGLVLEAPHVFCEAISVESIARARESYLHGDLRARLARYHGANTDVAFWGWNDAWLDPRFRSWSIEACLARVSAPALVIQSPDDPYGTLAQVEAIERGAGAPVSRALLGSGHSPHREDPEAVVASVASFVAGCRGGEPAPAIRARGRSESR